LQMQAIFQKPLENRWELARLPIENR